MTRHEGGRAHTPFPLSGKKNQTKWLSHHHNKATLLNNSPPSRKAKRQTTIINQLKDYVVLLANHNWTLMRNSVKTKKKSCVTSDPCTNWEILVEERNRRRRSEEGQFRSVVAHYSAQTGMFFEFSFVLRKFTSISINWHL